MRPSPSSLFGNGAMLVSDIPGSAFKEGVNMGIDEAGRGPVLGPMTYAAAFWAKSQDSKVPHGFNDSKQLTADSRENLYRQIMTCSEMGFVLRVLHASEISRNMLRKEPYNLNAMSHDAAMQMIQAVLDAGVKIHNCYVDTVGSPEAYQSRLNRVFAEHDINFVVEKKADSKYAECSAGSIVAKVARDRMIDTWKFSELNYEAVGGMNFGSGYPSDPKCKAWLNQNLADKIFGFPDLVRFSWGPTKIALLEKGIAVEWEADQDNEIDHKKKQQAQMKAFLTGSGPAKRKSIRLDYFETRKIFRVTSLVEV